MTPSEIKSVLARFGSGANKRLGQHFLIDPSVLEAMLDAARIEPGNRVIEIGPGLGVLTERLYAQGARVIAIERDRRFIEYLRGKMPEDRVSIRQADASRIDWADMVGAEPWKFVSNLPYAITSLALRKALYHPSPPQEIAVLVQREVAERAVARDGKTSLLSLMVALASSEAKIIRRVPPGAFFPPPKVESAVLKLTPLSPEARLETWGIEPERVMEVARVGFSHPRKKLVSNLKTFIETHTLLKRPSIFEKNEHIRAEALSPDDWVTLVRELYQG